MEVGPLIADLIDHTNLSCWSATDYKYGRGNRKSHCGYFEFTALNNPKVPKPTRVRIELMIDDTYAIKVTDLKSNEVLCEAAGVYCDNVAIFLDDIFG